MKKFLYSAFFIIIFITIFFNIEKILNNKMFIYNFKDFYAQTNNIDIIFIGTSKIQYTLSPMEIWHKYGITSYNRGTAAQYYKLTYFLIDEIFKYNKPKLIVVDIYNLVTLENYDPTNRTNLVINNLDNKINTYKAFYNVNETNSFKILDNMNIYKLFHQRWKELNMYDFKIDNFWFGRFSGTYIVYPTWRKLHSIQQVKIDNKEHINELIPIDNNTINYIEKINRLAQLHNTKVLFINMPFGSYNKKLYNLTYSLKEYAKHNNINIIDYNELANLINIDYNNDFMDINHLNLYGSRKVMDHLIPYIIEHYNIPNRKNDPSYASWNENYIKYARAINREEIRELKSFTDWKKQAFYDNYTVMISINGDVLKKLPDTLKNDLKSFGLNKYNTDKANMRYAAIIDDNKVFFEEISNKPVTYKGRMKNIVNLLVSSDGKATISVSGKPRSKNKYGLNFVIYDKVNREIVDSIWIDPNKPDIVRR